MLGVIIVNKKGVAIKSTMKPEENIIYGSLITQFADKVEQTTKALHDTKVWSEKDDVQFIKIRSNMYEIMIAPDKEFSMIVLQDDPAEMGKGDRE